MDITQQISDSIINASTDLSDDKLKALKRAIPVEDNEIETRSFH